jgi:hypothetical protein
VNAEEYFNEIAEELTNAIKGKELDFFTLSLGLHTLTVAIEQLRLDHISKESKEKGEANATRH